MSTQLALDGSEAPAEPVIRKGFCKCGCGERVEGRMEYKQSHRQRAYRKRVTAEMKRVGLPPSPSLKAAGVSRSTQRRNGDAPARRDGAQRTRSGCQVSYHKAVEAVAKQFPLIYRPLIEEALRSALSPRQREVLAERERAA